MPSRKESDALVTEKPPKHSSKSPTKSVKPSTSKVSSKSSALSSPKPAEIATHSKLSSPKSSAPSSSKSAKTSTHSKNTSSKSASPYSYKSTKTSSHSVHSTSTSPASSASQSKKSSATKSSMTSTIPRRSSAAAPAKSTASSASKPSKPRPTSEPPSPSLSALNRLPSPTAHTVFHAVCAAPTYVSLMQSTRPYRSLDHLLATSRASWNGLSNREWRAAFRAHVSPSRTPPDTNLMSSWIRRENSIVRHADAELRTSIRDLEKQYESKHGFPFVYYLAGVSPEKVQEELHARIGNITEIEMFEASSELVKIMEDRLKRAVVEANNL
eukprot:GFKZ01009627.1.p1 GENE.GFKZ01009627.1~~GFKZ01009627.1.p1  ORF type:complete len:327 (-),score=40.22 GFKZ01009627.1:446-1426(-)